MEAAPLLPMVTIMAPQDTTTEDTFTMLLLGGPMDRPPVLQDAMGRILHALLTQVASSRVVPVPCFATTRKNECLLHRDHRACVDQDILAFSHLPSLWLLITHTCLHEDHNKQSI